MSECVDHGTTFPNNHCKILPDGSIYGSKAIFLSKLQPQFSNFKQNNFGLGTPHAYLLLWDNRFFMGPLVVTGYQRWPVQRRHTASGAIG